MIRRSLLRYAGIRPALVVLFATTCTSAYAQSLTPHLGSPATVPGKIQAADFDDGGEGVAYHDRTVGNAGGYYRQTDVDIAQSNEGGLTLGWIDSGEWVNYTVNVVSSGSYTVQIRVAAPQAGTLHIGFNKSAGSWTAVTVPSTGGWQTWTTINVPLTLTAGVQQMTLLFDTGWHNLSYVNVVSTATGTTTTTTTTAAQSGTTPYSGSAVSVPGAIQAANFDNGGEGVAYHDTTSGNAGGAYRQTDVDIASSSEGGYTLGWVAAGEWANYTVNVTASGTYTAQLRVAALQTGTLHIGFNKSAGSWTAVTIPATGGWQAWTTVNVSLNLTAGVQVMTLGFDTGGYNVSSITMVSGGTTTTAPPPSAPSSGGRLRMMTWNIAQGWDVNHVYQLASQMSLVAAQNPDVIVLQEVQTWDEFQATKIPALLQQLTGRQWYTVWAPSSACLTGGCIGELIVSKIPIDASSTTYLETSDAARALIHVGGVPINILTNHLEYYNTSLRTTELNELMSWARNFGGPRLVGGDFNSWWGEWWILQMESEYHDSWFDVTKSQDGGYTRGSVRFDYIFRAFDGDYRVTPTNAYVVGTSLSDHNPVIVDFTVQ